MKFFLTTLLILIFASSCASRSYKHGFMFEFSEHEMLQEGVSTKERVIKMMGSPTIISDLNEEETWIYFSEKARGFLFFKPQITERDVLVVRFNNDTVRKLQKFDLNNEQKTLQFVSDFTAVESHSEDGFFKSIFNNVGQIKAQ